MKCLALGAQFIKQTLFVGNVTHPPRMLDSITFAPFSFLSFMPLKHSSRDGKGKEKKNLIYHCFLWFYCWCNSKEISGAPPARVSQRWATLRHFALRVWLSSSGKCFSVSAQHDKGINWLVDRVCLQGLDTPLICWMMPPVLFDGTANGRQ